MADDEGSIAAPVAAAAEAPVSSSHDAFIDGDARVEPAAAAEEETTRARVEAVGSEPTAASSSGPAIDPGRSILVAISSLKAQQKKLRDDKKSLSRELRNAERRRSRLKKRAKQLSDADLLAVISLRNHERALGAAAQHESESDSDSDGGEASTQAPEPAVSSSAKASPKRRR